VDTRQSQLWKSGALSDRSKSDQRYGEIRVVQIVTSSAYREEYLIHGVSFSRFFPDKLNPTHAVLHGR
jgi:hypothetical protein